MTLRIQEENANFREWRIVPFAETSTDSENCRREKRRKRKRERESSETIFLSASVSQHELAPRFDLANSRNEVPARLAGRQTRAPVRFSRIYVKYFAVLSIVLCRARIDFIGFRLGAPSRDGSQVLPICPHTSHTMFTRDNSNPGIDAGGGIVYGSTLTKS